MISDLLIPIAAIAGALLGIAGSRAAHRRRRRLIIRRVVRFGDRIPPLRAVNDNARNGFRRILGLGGGG
ncbi:MULTISPECIES: hypothetical protein [Methylorubrum]|jgi:hypothetical protein|uniref:Uncharacterized protein n=1 Tax=Methylorubrum extorquens DSM 13060 TaxID=882800 RepID=H1KGU8_METEX|nr:hypothetical protein [Methylorubrum extorquens]EHP93264.1 hypothetical protein MetexDRAFT_1860 [Methylorubrum extorquens DSM 13060]OAH21659.1 hypothetical protein AX289_17195 [Methylorubrum populi]